MSCKKIKNQLSLYLDDQLREQDSEKIKAHLNQCSNCREHYEAISDIKDYCSNLSQVEIPLGFHGRLRERLNEEGDMKVFKKRRGIPIAIGLAAMLVVIILGVGMMDALRLGQKQAKLDNMLYDTADADRDVAPSDGMYGGESMGKPSMEVAQEDSYKEERGAYDDGGVARAGDVSYDVDTEQVNKIDRKIIKSAYLGIETLEFDVLTNNIAGKVNMMGGYVESSNIQGVPRTAKGNSPARRAHFEIRIPGKKFDQFIAEVGDLGNLITKEIGGEDVTSHYFDTQARIKSLTIQEERLLSILEKAERLQDIIELESELTRVRYEIENYTGTLNRLDQMIDYSRISIDIYEVKEIKTTEPDPETLGQRIIQAFKQSLKNLGKFFEDLTISLVAALPYMIFIIPLVWIIWILAIRLIGNKVKNRKEDKDDQ